MGINHIKSKNFLFWDRLVTNSNIIFKRKMKMNKFVYLGMVIF